MSDPARPLPIPEGAELLEALARSLDGDEGWVQAVGWVEDAVLRIAAEGGDASRELRGRATLIGLSGPVGGPLMALLARSTGEGLELVGGALVRARALGVTAVLTPYGGDDGAARARGSTTADEPRATGRDVPSEASSAGPPRRPPTSPEVPASSHWVALATASAEAAREEEPPPEELGHPEPGDRVQHFAFGLCDVLMVDGDALRIRDVRGVGRVREIRIDKLLLLAPTYRDGKRVFKLERRG